MLDVVMPFNQPASLPFYNPHVHMASNGIVDEIDLLNPSSLYSIHWPPPTDFHLPVDWPQPDPFRNATAQQSGPTWNDPSPFGGVEQSIRTNTDDDFDLNSSSTAVLPSISSTRNRGRARPTRSLNSTTTSARMRRHPNNIPRDLREQSPRQHGPLSSSPTAYHPADPRKLSYAQPQHAIQPETQYAHGPTAPKRRRIDAHSPPQPIAPSRPLHSPVQQADPFQQHHHHHHQPTPHAPRQSEYYPSPPSWQTTAGPGSHHATSSSPTWPSHHHQPYYAAGPPQHHGPSPMMPLHLQQPPVQYTTSPSSPSSSAPLPPPHLDYRRGTSAQASHTDSSWKSTDSVAVPDNDVHHPLSEFPPKPYKDGPNAISPWWPTKVVGKIYGSRLEQMPAIENRLARLEDNVDRYIDTRCEQALRNSQLPGLAFDPPPVQTKPKGASRLFGGRIWPTALARRVKRNRDRDS